MAREFAEHFYNSTEWKKTRELYAKKVGGLCERCWEQGIVTPGEIVHHKIHINPANIDDPHITLDFGNLQLVCRDCHAKIHAGIEARRYEIAPDGSVKI